MKNGNRLMSLPFHLPSVFRATADLVVAVHAAFVVFVVFGGLLVAHWPRLAWVHVPAAAWGVFIEFRGWICPLTPLENYLRQRGGSSAYQGEFIEHYILPLLYPANLTPRVQIWLGSLALAVNSDPRSFGAGTSRAWSVQRAFLSDDIDLVVVGTHGRGDASPLLIGSVAERVVHMATCPVITVRHPAQESAVSQPTQLDGA